MSIQTASLRITHEPGGKVYVTVRTPQGAAVIDLDQALWQGKEYFGVYVAKTDPKAKSMSKKRQKRASIDQENDIMEALGGRRQAGSGAVAHLKGDGRVRDKYRVEAKYTRSSSYRVTRQELNKIRGECTGTEIPLFVVDFVDPETGGAGDRWVMLEFNRFKQLEYKPIHATSDTGRPEPIRRGARAAHRSGAKAK